MYKTLKTHEVFLEDLYKRSERYRNGEYTIVGEYNTAKTPIDVLTKYGVCSVTPDLLYRGGMPTIKSAINKTEYIVNRFKEVHGDEFDYSKVVYNGDPNHVEIVCNLHGSFFQAPTHHLAGASCPKCSAARLSKKFIKSKEQFISDAKVVHGERYDYSKLEYTGNKDLSTIICRLHGEFKQTPIKHLYGQNCPKCANDALRDLWAAKPPYKNNTATLYLVLFESDTEVFIKIGITKNTVKKRFCGKSWTDLYKITTVYEVVSLRSLVWDMETTIKDQYSANTYKPLNNFAGHSTECFPVHMQDDIIELMNQLKVNN